MFSVCSKQLLGYKITESSSLFPTNALGNTDVQRGRLILPEKGAALHQPPAV